MGTKLYMKSLKNMPILLRKWLPLWGGEWVVDQEGTRENLGDVWKCSISCFEW